MLMISREAMQSVTSLREKITDPEKRAECIGDVESMIGLKESHLARAEWGSCCGNICNLVPQIEAELQMLQSILGILRKGDSVKAGPLLEEYLAFLQKYYRPEPDNW
jgi:hypothetical protein